MENATKALKLIESARQIVAFYTVEHEDAELIKVISLLNEAIDKILDK